MEKAIKFRHLEAGEISCRVGRVNKGGAALLLYKDARADQRILDETVGPLNWQKHYTRDNANCIVSIRNPETGEWIEKEDVGEESNTAKEKGLASDSFKRACTCWGIGRELYSASDLGLFVRAQNLKAHNEQGGKFTCGDDFLVNAIEYDGEVISKVVIDVAYYGKVHDTLTFTRNASTTSTASDSKPKPAPKPATPMISEEELTILEAKAEFAGATMDSVSRWIEKQFGISDPKQLTEEQYKKTIACLDKQAKKNGGES